MNNLYTSIKGEASQCDTPTRIEGSGYTNALSPPTSLLRNVRVPVEVISLQVIVSLGIER